MRGSSCVVACLIVLGCAPVEEVPSLSTPRFVVRNPAYIVLRPLSTEQRPNASEASEDGTTFYFEPADVLIDLSHVQNVKSSESAMGSPILIVQTTDAGAAKLKAWTTSNVGGRLGVFVDGKLISAPIVTSPISDMFVLDGAFTKAQADEIEARIRRGGAP